MKFINHTIKKKEYTLNNNYTDNKLVLISDIHYSSSFKKEKLNIILEEVAKENPNYICITGDIIDSNKTVEDDKLRSEILEFINNLSKIAKVIISIGNHDKYKLIRRAFRCIHEYQDNQSWFNTLSTLKNVYLLDNGSITFDNITFTGITLSDNYYKNEGENNHNIISELNEKLKIENRNYNLLLIHSPIHVLEENTYENTDVKKIDLILSGHTHNGVMPPILDDIFKGNNGLFSPSNKWFSKAKFTRGKCQYKNTNLIINGAITKIHECSPKVLVPLNELFPMSVDVINLVSNNEKNISK